MCVLIMKIERYFNYLNDEQLAGIQHNTHDMINAINK